MAVADPVPAVPSGPRIIPLPDGEVRFFEPSVQDRDLSRMYVLEVHGMSLLIRERPNDNDEEPHEVYVHIDNEERSPGPLVVEVCNSGGVEYCI